MATPIQTEFNWPTIISRRDAHKAGNTLYFTGKPCKYGHISERRVTGGKCLECQAMDVQHNRNCEWRLANRERLLEEKRAWYTNNPTKVQLGIRRSVAARRKRLKDPKALKAYTAKGTERRRILRIQNAERPKPACCDICRRKSEKICFDHCHKSDKFRGWLCSRCNLLLGNAEDSPELLIRMAEYLKAFQKSLEPVDG